MNEQQWLACTDPGEMFEVLRGPSWGRELRLFACAVTRLLPPHQCEDFDRDRAQALAVAERLALGQATPAELAEVARSTRGGVWPFAVREPYEAALLSICDNRLPDPPSPLADLLRDIFGNPFRPVALDPAWRTPIVTRLAEAAYAERELPGVHLDAARLAVLADALEEAGCDSADLLAHLRGPGPHVRGCWALDLVLGKE